MPNFSEHLRFVADQCPLPGSEIKSLRHTRWYAEAHAEADKLVIHTDDYTQTVLANRWFGWYRTFSALPPGYGGTEVGYQGSHPRVHKRPLIVLSEWIPEHHLKQASGWFSFGPHYTCAYAKLHANYRNDWRSHAKKHLKAFLKTGCSFRLGTRAEVAKLYAVSQVPKSLQTGLLKMLDRHLAVHPETIDILIAEKDSRPIACLVAGNCDQVKTSEYLIGAFHPDYKDIYAMVGLVDWWYQKSLARGYVQVNFGHMEPPGRHFVTTGSGYSFFKTHFGVFRVWFPKNQWRVFINR